MRRAALMLGLLALLSPVGLLLPLRFKAGPAWGEWSTVELAEMTGRLPEGLKRLNGLWRAPLQAYALPGHSSASLPQQSLDTAFSALIGVALTLALGWGLGYLLLKKKAR